MSKSKSVIAVNEQIAKGGNVGAIVWWVLNGNVNHSALVTALAGAGVKAELMPPTVLASSALRRAVKAQEEKRFLGRPLGRGVGWALVREEVTEAGESLAHETVLKVKLTETESMEASPEGPLAAEIRAKYNASLSELTPQDIGAWVVASADKLHALRLRERGGVYFIPADALPVWHSLVNAMRAAHSGHDLYEVPAMRSEEAVKAILDAVVREAEEEATTMREEMLNGELGGRALNGRADRCSDIAAKVEKYEELLGVTQAALRSKLDSLRADLTVAALTAMADD